MHSNIINVPVYQKIIFFADAILVVFNLPKMALQKVKGNLERMFDKNLNDLVRGIR